MFFVATVYFGRIKIDIKRTAYGKLAISAYMLIAKRTPSLSVKYNAAFPRGSQCNSADIHNRWPKQLAIAIKSVKFHRRRRCDVVRSTSLILFAADSSRPPPYCLFPLCDAAKSNKRKCTARTGRVLGRQWNGPTREGRRMEVSRGKRR